MRGFTPTDSVMRDSAPPRVLVPACHSLTESMRKLPLYMIKCITYYCSQTGSFVERERRELLLMRYVGKNVCFIYNHIQVF